MAVQIWGFNLDRAAVEDFASCRESALSAAQITGGGAAVMALYAVSEQVAAAVVSFFTFGYFTTLEAVITASALYLKVIVVLTVVSSLCFGVVLLCDALRARLI